MNISMIQAVIVAGGLATRLGDEARDCPKSMVYICGKPFVEYQLQLLQENGITGIVLCLGHLAVQIEQHLADGAKFGVNITYSHESQPLGTAGALKNAQRLIKGDFLTLYGDSYLDFDYQSAVGFFNRRNKLALMTVYKNHGLYDASNSEIEGELVTGYDKIEKTPKTVYIDYGASIFRREVLDWLPINQPYSLEQLFRRLIVERELLAYEVMERFYEIGSPGGLEEFRRLKGGRYDSITCTG
ncbi:MAG: sugar phosphate nucleotidyltransferase [Chloroflexi bacterium]|nr:sugar phosphate nucleotidyltransferase [Chloroflexota bacterium]